MIMHAQVPDSVLIKKKDDYVAKLNAAIQVPDSIDFKIKWPQPTLPKLNLKKPLSISGGNLLYQYDYRSNIDTPFLDKNISQHYLNGQINVTAFNAVPLTVTFLIRETNSSIFRDIHDV